MMEVTIFDKTVIDKEKLLVPRLLGKLWLQYKSADF